MVLYVNSIYIVTTFEVKRPNNGKTEPNLVIRQHDLRVSECVIVLLHDNNSED